MLSHGQQILKYQSQNLKVKLYGKGVEFGVSIN